MHYSDDDQLQSDALGDLTPTSNRTRSPSSARYTNSAPHSPQSASSWTGSHASSILSLPPLSIPPRILDALHRELAEKSQLLSLANDHIQHQSVQLQHMQAKLSSYQEANHALLSANVSSGGAASGGRGEEVRQLKVLVSHLYNMIAQRDVIVEEQESELHYYQRFMTQYKQEKEREVEREREREKERDRERERMKQLELEVHKYRAERKAQEEREERKEQEQGGDGKRQDSDPGRKRREAEGEERKGNSAGIRSPPSSRRVRSSPPPPVPPPPLKTDDSPVPCTTSAAPPLAVSLSRPASTAASLSPSSVSSPRSSADARSMNGVSPITALSPASTFRQSPHGLLPKVRRASPMSASAASSPELGSAPATATLTRSATPPLMSLTTAGKAAPEQKNEK